MYLNVCGKIVAEEWHRTEELRDEVSLDAFIVMPDHIHGILWIDSAEGSDSERTREARLANTSQESISALENPQSGTLSTIIGAFKSAVTRRINKLRETPGESVWQSSFHDRIVRNRDELQRIRQYIRTNPHRWLGKTLD